MPVLALDVGGTKVAVALVTRQSGILAKTRQLTDLAGPEAVVEQIAAMSTAVVKSRQPRAIGACVPAALAGYDTDLVRWAPNLPGWRDVPLREMLQERLKLPTFLEFDGHATALGEWWVGAGRGYQSVVAVIIGTGIGGKVIPLLCGN